MAAARDPNSRPAEARGRHLHPLRCARGWSSSICYLACLAMAETTGPVSSAFDRRGPRLSFQQALGAKLVMCRPSQLDSAVRWSVDSSDHSRMPSNQPLEPIARSQMDEIFSDNGSAA